MSIVLEVCVDDPAGVSAAVDGGADRIELCSSLSAGGLTPSAGLIRFMSGFSVPAFAMIRPRAGGFVWSGPEIETMLHDIAAVQDAGLAGVVLGSSRADGTLDAKTLRHLVAASGGLGLTLHRCFDLTPDPVAALEEAIEIGFHRILTSGQALRAWDGRDLIARLAERAAGRIAIMPGSGIGPKEAAHFSALGFREIHASCRRPQAISGPEVAFGFADAEMAQTDPARVRAIRAAFEG